MKERPILFNADMVCAILDGRKAQTRRVIKPQYENQSTEGQNLMKSSLIKSPLRYPGGKSRAVKHILPYFPENTTTVVSPFMGGSSVELNLAAKGIEVYASDKFEPLCAFWYYLQHNPSCLADAIKNYYPLNKEGFYLFQEIHKKSQAFSLESAALFYVLNRSSFDGTTLSGGCSNPSNRFNAAAIDRVRNWQKVSNFDIGCGDYRGCIDHDRGNATFFFDPPYWIGSNLYGNGGDLHKHFDHQEFAEYLFNLDNWILCYNDRPEIRSLYANYKIVTPEWSYGMGKNKSSREVLILNI